jgi:hypothetical protein
MCSCLDDEFGQNPELGTLSNTVLTDDKNWVVTYNHFYGTTIRTGAELRLEKKLGQSDHSLKTAGGVRNFYRSAL